MAETERNNLDNDQHGLAGADALRMLEQRSQSDCRELACRPDIDQHVLRYLAEHGGVATRRAVAAHRAATPSTNWLLCDDEDDEVRAELARKIARLLPDLSRNDLVDVRERTLEVLEKLAADQVPQVRAILAEEIRHLDCVPKPVVDRLARDVEVIVSAPILEYSPLLADCDLLEIIASAQADHVLSAIARRNPVSGEVSDAIAASLDIPAVATLLANPNAQIREEALDRLAQAAEGIEAWHEPFAMRTDLSVRVTQKLARFVSSALLDQLSVRCGLDDTTHDRLYTRSLARIKETEQVRPSSVHAGRAVSEAASDGGADKTYIEELVEGGNPEVVAAALSALTRAPLNTVRSIVGSRSAKAITALAWRAGLNMRTAFKIQYFVAKLSSGECLPSVNGRDYPLSEADMREQLALFGL